MNVLLKMAVSNYVQILTEASIVLVILALYLERVCSVQVHLIPFSHINCIAN